MGAQWLDGALCAAPDVDGDWWFPERNKDFEAYAKRECLKCPARVACAAAAVADIERDPRAHTGSIRAGVLITRRTTATTTKPRALGLLRAIADEAPATLGWNPRNDV